MKNGLNIEVEIDLSKICENIKSAKDRLQRINARRIDFCLMLKADAYGHGLEKVAEATRDCVDSFGVVTLKEGLKVCKIARKTPVFVTMPLACEIEKGIREDLTLGISNRSQLYALFECVKNGETKVHSPSVNLIVDSGMHRLGFDVGEVEEVVGEFKSRNVKIDGVCSHFGDHAETQKDRFDYACKIVREAYPTAKRHIASSHTFLNPDYAYDGVRIGLFAYLGAMSVKGRVIAVHSVSKGEYVGYGNFVSKEDMQVAVVFGGYADGIDRAFRYFAYNGKKLPIICVCMDLTIVDTNGERIKEGDVVEIVNNRKILEIADDFSTIPYTLMTAWQGRIERKYTVR